MYTHMKKLLLLFSLMVACPVFAQTSGAPTIYRHDTDCVGGIKGQPNAFCIQASDDSLWYCKTTAAGTSSTVCDHASDWKAFPMSGASFLALTDTPDSYSGQGTKCVVVNAGETALEFVTCGTGSGDISDVWMDLVGGVDALTAAAGDSLDAGAADASSPSTRSTTLPATCNEGQSHQDTDSGGTETYICTATNTWTKLITTTDTVDLATLATTATTANTGDSATAFFTTGTLEVARGGTGLGSGTSGGVLAYTASGTLASSAALTADMPVIGGGAGVAPSVGTRSGNTTAYVTTTGTQTSGRCVEIDANGNHIAAAGGCAGGGISGLTTGTIPKAASATTLENSAIVEDADSVNFSKAIEVGSGTPTVDIGSSHVTLLDESTACDNPAASNTALCTISGELFVKAPGATSREALTTAGGDYGDFTCSAGSCTLDVAGGGITSLASQTGATQTITRGTGIAGTSGTNDHSFVLKYSDTLAANVALNAEECIFTTDGTSGGGFLCEGSTGGNTNEQLHLFPAADGADTTDFIATSAAAVTDAIGAATTNALTNKAYDVEGTGNAFTIYDEIWSDVAGCDNVTAGPVWNNNTANSPAYACEGTNTRLATAAFDATTDESVEGSFVLPTGFTGAIDIFFKWKAAATTGAAGWCMQLIRVADGSTSDPAQAAQASGNCVSDTAKGTTLQENDATITGVTCTSCAAGDRINFRLSRDANGGAVTDDMTGDALLLSFGRRVRKTL